jgi:hypothetical protein
MSDLVNIAQQFSGLPMESLIGGPLCAAAEANARMAHTQSQFILNTCFNSRLIKAKRVRLNNTGGGYESVDEEVKMYDPILINLEMIRPALDDNGNQLLGSDNKPAPPAIFQIKVPLMAVIPINSLAVQSVDINFEMEVKSSFEEKVAEKSGSEKKAETGFEAEVGNFFVKATIKGSASYSSSESKERDTHYQKSNNAKYTVAVKAGQLPMPTGITTILDLYVKNMFPEKIAALAKA